MNDCFFFAGLDLGQVNDPTALAILERQSRVEQLPPAQRNYPARVRDLKPVYAVRHLHRFPLGTSYPSIVAGVRDTLTRPPLDKANVLLAVDKTGCGAAVCDLVRPLFPSMVAVTITGGEAVSLGPDGINVPKRELAGTLQVLMQTRRLLIAQNLPEASLLIHELENFKVKINIATGSESFEAWREKDHDDLVLAVALAAWLGERVPVSVPAPRVYEIPRGFMQ